MEQVALQKINLDLKRDFPALHQVVHGKPLVYLDSASTSQKPQKVIDAICNFYKNDNANINRGMHTLSSRATIQYGAARKKVARFVNALPQEIVFTKNATESINLVVNAWGRQNLGRGDIILLTEMEHHSNLVPWQQIASACGAVLEFVPCTAQGVLDFVKAKELIPMARIFACTHISNVVGSINPVKELFKIAKINSVVTLLDAAQSVPHMQVDVKDIGADFVAFSGHKMLGPTGIGVLYGRYDILNTMQPFISGGGSIKEVELHKTILANAPERFEGGTPHIAGAIGLAAAIDYLEQVGMENVYVHSQELGLYAYEELSKIPQVVVYGPKYGRCGVVSFNLGDMHSHDVASILDEEGVAIRSGHHCAQPLMNVFGVQSTCRASFYLYNTKEDVDAFICAVKKAVRVFRL